MQLHEALYKRRNQQTKADTIIMLLLHKQVHDKRSIVKALHAYINRARLTVCVRWAYFWAKYHNSWNTPTSLFEKLLKFIAHGRTYFWEITVAESLYLLCSMCITNHVTIHCETNASFSNCYPCISFVILARWYLISLSCVTNCMNWTMS